MMNLNKKIFISILFFFGGALLSLYSQQSTNVPDEYSMGRFFIIANPDTVSNTVADTTNVPRITDLISVYIYSPVANKIKIVNPSSDIANVYTVEARKFLQVDLNGVIKFPRPIEVLSGIKSQASMRIEAESPVITYVNVATKYGAEMYTALPVEAWGTEYIAATTPSEIVMNTSFIPDPKTGNNTIGFTFSGAPAEVLIIAAHDNTVVSFSPTCQLSPEPAEGYAITLNADEVFQFTAATDTTLEGFGGAKYDLAGTRISASKPIGVISGNSRGRVTFDQTSSTSNNSARNLMIEALSPIDLHGTKFVYMPTFDDLIPTANAKGKRGSEVVRAYGTAPNKKTKVTVTPVNGTGTPQVLYVNNGAATTMNDMKFIPSQPRFIKTDLPAQLIMNSTGVVDSKVGARSSKTDPNVLTKSLDADTRSPYSLELIPREQWVSFAPFYCPVVLGADYEHRINVVSDSANNGKIKLDNGSIILLNKPIPGTKLAWGSSIVNTGPHYVESTNGAKFFAMIYATAKGDEYYIEPAGTTPPEYGEFQALSYGYPAAPLRYAFRREDTIYRKYRDSLDLTYGDSLNKRIGDSLLFVDNMTCGVLETEINTHNITGDLTFVGIRSIELVNPVNTNIEFLNPTKLIDIPGSTEIKYRVSPKDATKDASATILIRDRSGKVWRRPYLYQKIYLDFAPTFLDFETVSFGQPSDTKDVIVTNPLQVDVTLNSIKMKNGNYGFKLTNLPNMPLKLKPGEQVRFKAYVEPIFENREFSDSILIDGGCAILRMPVKATTIRTCVYAEDLDFGPLQVGQTRNSYFRICCREGILKFDNPQITKIISWLGNTFEINQADIDALRTKVLTKNECASIAVKFTAVTPGEYITNYKVFSNANNCIKDTGFIRAYVSEPGKPAPKISGHDFGKRWVVNSNKCTKNELKEYDTLIWVNNEGTAPYKVKKIELLGQDAADGIFVLGNGPTDGTEVFDGDPVSNRRYQVIYFRPNAERIFTCTAKLTTETGVEKTSTITGEGIESHVDVADLVFEPTKYKGIGVQEPLIVTAKPTRTLTITDIIIKDDSARVFSLAPGYVKPTKNKPVILEPGEPYQVAIQFKSKDAGKFTATVCVVADHSICDDSCGVVSATLSDTVEVPPQDIKFNITDLNFKPVLTCLKDTGYVVVTNIGTGNALVKSAVMATANSAFTVDQSALPKLLAPGVQVRIGAVFTPPATGTFTDDMLVTVADENGKVLPTLKSKLSGNGIEVSASTNMPKSYTAKPWGSLVVPIVLENEIDAANITGLKFKVNYNMNTLVLTNGTEDLKNTLLDNTILKGWTVNIVNNTMGTSGGQLDIEVKAPTDGTTLKGSGQILSLDFGLFLGAKNFDSISYKVSPLTNDCITFTGSPSVVYIDNVCGTSIRLVELTNSTYALKQNSPNPFNPSTDIEFSLGLDAQTSMDIYNAKGERVTTLFNQYMKPGTYKVSWDATAFPSGLYYYRLNSGTYTQTNTMLLQK